MHPTTDLIQSIFQIDDYDELRKVWSAVRDQFDTLQRRQKFQFAAGDRVVFTDKRGRPVAGVVVKRMQKNISVLADNGVKWTVAPSLLTKE